MAWYCITNKQTKDVEIVASLRGYDLDQWQVLAIKGNRAPGEFQTVKSDGGVKTDKARKDEARRKASIRAMDSADRFDKLMGEIEALKARLAKAGI